MYQDKNVEEDKDQEISEADLEAQRKLQSDLTKALTALRETFRETVDKMDDEVSRVRKIQYQALKNARNHMFLATIFIGIALGLYSIGIVWPVIVLLSISMVLSGIDLVIMLLADNKRTQWMASVHPLPHVMCRIFIFGLLLDFARLGLIYLCTPHIDPIWSNVFIFGWAIHLGFKIRFFGGTVCGGWKNFHIAKKV